MKTKLAFATAIIGQFLLSSAAQGAEYVFVSYPGVAPYIVQEDNQRTGIEIEVVDAAMAAAGHTVKYVTLPFGRAIKQFKNKKVDGALTISPSAGLDLGETHFSDSHITFRNVAISLTKNGFEIPDIASLGKYSIASFEFATQYLGEEFATMAKANSRYREMIPDTRPIPPTLYAKRAEVVVIEINIFKYHLKKETYTVDIKQPITVHRVFPENPFAVAFADPNLRDEFNAGLKTIRENGTYKAIFENYIGSQ